MLVGLSVLVKRVLLQGVCCLLGLLVVSSGTVFVGPRYELWNKTDLKCLLGVC